jgi:hypothetical protein
MAVPHRVSIMFDRFCQDSHPGKSQDSDAASSSRRKIACDCTPYCCGSGWGDSATGTFGKYTKHSS